MSLQRIHFELYDDEAARKLAVVQVTNPSTYERGLPKSNGVCDPRMGVTEKGLVCPTCGLPNECTGHYGFVELCKPVMRVGHVASVIALLRCVCWACSRPKFFDAAFEVKEALNSTGLFDANNILFRTRPQTKERLRLLSESCKNRLRCGWEDCGAPQPVYTRVNKLFIRRYFAPKQDKLFECQDERVFANKRLLPDEIQSILRHIPHDALETLGYQPRISHPERFVTSVQLVPPMTIRPGTFGALTEARVRGENDLTVAIQELVRANKDLGTVLESEDPDQAVLHKAWDRVQIFAAAIIVQTAKKLLTFDGEAVVHARAMGKRVVKDLKARLTGKKGRLRGNLAGKRVDYSARTVVGPDVSHDIWQLGVPELIMRTLTFPECVSDFSVLRLGEAVRRGANARHGALTVKTPAGHVLYLSLLDESKRAELALTLTSGWVVERHLREGDWVLFNRQPSLHKASIMAFQAYEVSCAQFKLSLPCTKAFNADFDGDEMNLHALQDWSAIAEAQELMAVPHQMVSPQSNSTLIALVQDSIVGAFMMSRRDALFSREHALQLMTALSYNPSADNYSDMPSVLKNDIPIRFLPAPAILKSLEGPMWTGKQIIELMFPESLTLTKAGADADSNSVEDILNDRVTLVRRGYYACGRLCKQTVGTSSNSIVLALWKRCGPWAAAKFVSDAQRLFMQWLRNDTISISIQDCLHSDQESVNAIVQKTMDRVRDVSLTGVPYPIRDAKESQLLQEALRVVGAKVLGDMNPNSGISVVVASGSKGNVMNIAQIAGVVGQQTIGGMRICGRRGPKGVRTLACFEPDDDGPAARGFIAASYTQGLSPSQFFFHQQAGREGVVATAVQTADTGYNQRKMTKNQESEVVAYDGTVRVSSSAIIQMHYGGDDYEGSHVERVKLPAIFNHEARQYLFDRQTPRNEQAQILAACDILSSLLPNTLGEIAMPTNFDRLLHGATKSESSGFVNRDEFLRALLLGILSLHHSSLTLLNLNSSSSLDAIIWLPDRDFRIADDPSKLARFALVVQCNSASIRRSKLDYANAKLLLKQFLREYKAGLVQPGEGVGALGSSCIGEPTTQLTLNTFHYTGIAEKNVTIAGLPRFKQILNAIDTKDTSNMKLFPTAATLGPTKSEHRFSSRAFANRITRTRLRDVVLNSNLKQRDNADLAWKLDALTSSTVLELRCSLKSARTKKRQRKDDAPASSAESRFSSCAIQYCIDKEAASNRDLDPESIGLALQEFLGSDSIVTWTMRWQMDWFVFVRLPASGPEDKQKDADVADSLRDSLLDQAIVGGLRYISKAVAQNDADTWFVATDGSDLRTMSRLPAIDHLRTSSNNIPEVHEVFGVEAAAFLIHAELQRVLGFDGSHVDPRHTWLLADTVTRSGDVRALNRHNMEELGGSILLCAAFEQTLDVLETGAAFGKCDALGGATEKLIVGQPVHVGTGSFSLISDVHHQPATTFVPPLGSGPVSTIATAVPSLWRQVSGGDSLGDVLNSRISENVTSLLGFFRAMREGAARRTEILLCCSLKPSDEPLNEADFLLICKKLGEYQGWHSRLMHQSATETTFQYEGLEITTVSSFTSTLSIQHFCPLPDLDAVQLHLSGDNIGWSLILDASARHSNNCSDAVLPTQVLIREFCEFEKSHWTFRTSRTWFGQNLEDVETQRQSGQPQFEISVSLKHPSDYLETETTLSDHDSAQILVNLAASCLDVFETA